MMVLSTAGCNGGGPSKPDAKDAASGVDGVDDARDEGPGDDRLVDVLAAPDDAVDGPGDIPVFRDGDVDADANADAGDDIDDRDQGHDPDTSSDVGADAVEAAPPVACSDSGDCAAGACVDGYCCDQPCAGPCVACDRPGREGVCTFVPGGTDPEADCNGAGPCGGVCNGRGACRYPDNATPCGAVTCEASMLVGDLCDGSGACLPASVRSCVPFECASDGRSCATSCQGDPDCPPDFYCKAATCTACTPTIDEDRDGATARRCGGPDCNDRDPAIKPGALDLADVVVEIHEVVHAGATPPVPPTTMVSLALVRGGGSASGEVDVGIAFTDGEVVRLGRRTAATGTWAITVAHAAPDVRGSPALSYDGAGVAHLLFDGGALAYLTDAGGSWTRAAAATDGGRHPALLVDREGNLHAADFRAASRELRVLQKPPSGPWTAPEIVDARTASTSAYPSLAADDSGAIHLAFYDDAADLVYARRPSGGAWTFVPVDFFGNTGLWSSLAVDATGKARVTYVDVTGARIRYATNASGMWTIETVEDAGAGLAQTSLAVDDQGPHVAYHSGAPGRDLHLATRLTGVWSVHRIDTAGITGRHVSMKAGPDGRLHIGYFTDESAAVKYARVAVTNRIDENCDAK